ncbi:histidinol-phosphate transaminase [Ruminococcus sp. Marseille-P6503]|uniref:histidinol-phosphate transaminase n=1 Tax=Ruminococcus sp. Marseille-P6503 TaxID=2364796 RepID=UPI000F533DDF|nr:histidinol-phosphate transaminase [Ruminococcus sp. Marseille-P6503]
MSEGLWRKNLINIEPYVAGEQPASEDILKLNANENPYPPSPMVQRVIREFDAEGLKKYPSMDAAVLREAAAEYYGLKKENVFAGNGSDDVLAAAFRAFFNSDKPIVFPDITYSFYPVWCSLLNIPYRTFAVNEAFEINTEDYYAPNGGVVIPNPNAPTSVELGRDRITDILEHNRDCIVIIDEAYIDFGGQSSVELIKKYDNLVVTQTFSKSRSLAGMRIAAAFAAPELIAYLDAVKDSYNSYPVDSIASAAAAAALKDREYFEKTRRQIIRTRDSFAESLRGMGFKVLPSSTNFVFCTHPEFSARDIFEYARSRNIYIRYFDKPRIDNYLRITIGTDRQMNTLEQVLREFIIKE